MIGIYYIKCLISKKVYIGSSDNIDRRLKRHIWNLNMHNHPNYHLQSAVSKYGMQNFRMGVIQICEEEELSKLEQFYIDHNRLLYNIVKIDIKRPSLDLETRQKLSRMITEMYKNGEIPRFNRGSIKKGTKPWNTGKKYDSTDHLKVPKLNKGSRKNFIKTMEEKASKVRVYDLQGNILGVWRSAKILKEDSLKEEFKLIEFMRLRNLKGRNGYNPYILQPFNIQKSSRTKLPYKGLVFELFHDLDKSGELRES